MINAVPTLSTSGWTKDTDGIMLKLFEYFLTSEYSRSNTYSGNISSLKYILQRYTLLDEIQNELRSTLNKLYSRYFSTVAVEVSIDESDKETVYVIEITVIDSESKTHLLSKNIETIGDKIKNIDKLTEDIRK